MVDREIGRVKFWNHPLQWGKLLDQNGREVGFRTREGFDVIDGIMEFEPEFYNSLPETPLHFDRDEEIIFERGFDRWGKPIANRWARLSEWQEAKKRIKAREYRVLRVIETDGLKPDPEYLWRGRNLRELLEKFPLDAGRGGTPYARNPLIQMWHDPARNFTVSHTWEVFYQGDWKVTEDPRTAFALHVQRLLNHRQREEQGIFARD